MATSSPRITAPLCSATKREKAKQTYGWFGKRGVGGEGRGAGERGGERCSSKKISIKMAVLHEVCTAKSLHATDKRLSLTAARNVNCDN